MGVDVEAEGGQEAVEAGEVGGDDDVVFGLAEHAQLFEEVLAELKFDGVFAARHDHDCADGADGVGGGAGDSQNLFGAALGFVDAALHFAFGAVDGFLFLAFGVVDLGLLAAFNALKEGAAVAFSAHLALHGGAHGLGGDDVFEFVAVDFDAPGLFDLVHDLDDAAADAVALFKGLVEGEGAEDRAGGGLGKLDGGVVVVGDAVAGALGVADAHVHDGIDQDA